MMKATLGFIFTLVFLAITSPVLAQSERMSEADYNTAFAKALEMVSTRDRRVVTIKKFYGGAKLVGTRKIVTEFSDPDAKKVEATERFGDSISKKEAIKVGDQFYCRDGDEGWKKSRKDCSTAGQLAIPHGNYEYLVETDAKESSRRIYTRRAKFVDSGLPERDAVRLKFIEIKFTTGENGIVEYAETRRGGIEPNGWSSTQVTTYEYDPTDLKIVDPTKENL